MSQPFLRIDQLERRLATGGVELLGFDAGVNLLIGPPSTGKTKWLQTLDYLLGDVGENPFQGLEETGLAERYDAAAVTVSVDEQVFRIERRWTEVGSKTKVFVNGEGMSARDFQQWLMTRLGMPLLSFPKGNPMSGQTWPELSFRMLLRHIYRQQRFWGGIADQQPDAEQHACLLQFLGIAEQIFTDAYGELIQLKLKAEKLKTRRENYHETLEDVARDLISEPGLTVSLNATTVRESQKRLTQQTDELVRQRQEVLTSGSQRAIPEERRGHISLLGERRAELLVAVEEHRRKLKVTQERVTEMRRYRTDLTDELERIARVEDASAVLSDLRITHCPACDQTVEPDGDRAQQCFLCHQDLPDEPMIEELGAVRLRFEQDRLSGELKEADELIDVLRRDETKIASELTTAEEALRAVENQLIPARQAVSGLVQEEVSAIDIALGQVSERERQLGRITAALQLGEDLTKEIKEVEEEIVPLQAQVDEAIRAIDFEAAAALLEDGMNEYLNSINILRPHVWRHSAVNIDLSRWGVTFRVGTRRWNVALGGTDTLYFLMAYHYGLLTLSDKAGCHYPGLAIIDVPGEFSGEAIEDKENFIVQPFVELLSRSEYAGAQLIMTGAAFSGLDGAHFQRLTHVYAA
jgi:hypothetical protein